MKLPGIFTFWKRWDDNERASAVKIIGLLMAAFTVFTLLATCSYMLHWRADMSGEAVSGAAGSLGYRFGKFLVCDCFGIGSLALLVILASISARLLIHKWHANLLKTCTMALTGAFLAAILFSYIGGLSGLTTAFGGGLGGECGSIIIEWSIGLFGTIITGLFVVILCFCWMIGFSRKFSMWINGLAPRAERKEKKAKAAAVKAEPVEDPAKETGEEEDPLAEAPESEEAIEPVMAEDETHEPIDVTVDPAPVPENIPEVISPEGGLEVVTDDTLEAEIKELPRMDNRMDPPEGLPKFKFPSLSLLDNYDSAKREVSGEELTRNNNKIRAALANYKIQVTDVKAIVGPTVTLYKVYPAAGVKISDIKSRQEDIAMSLNARGVRVVTLSDSVGIEVANDNSSIVPLKALLNDESFKESKAELPVAIGYTITQKVKVFDLADAPHLLVAGATKQGKSVGLNVIVSSLLYSKHPSELKFVFIDPKMVEFSSYAKLYKHYLAVLPEAESDEDEKDNAIVKNAKNAERILRSLCIEMDARYELLSKAYVNKISLYNDKYKDHKLNPEHGHRFLPYLVVVVDEYADLTMTMGASADVKALSRSITNSIIRLAQKGRAAGLHVILATQRPSVDVISGIIKSNFPMRIAFRTASRVDSTTILDAPGAEKLIGRGDMLFSAGIETERIQCGYVGGEEIERINDFIGDQSGYGKSYNTPYYLPLPAEQGSEGGGNIDMSTIDERFEEAARMVVTTQKGSTSDLQRKLGMGYAKAGRVMDQLEAAGIVGPQEGSKPRQVLVPDFEALEPILNAFRK